MAKGQWVLHTNNKLRTADCFQPQCPLEFVAQKATGQTFGSGSYHAAARALGANEYMKVLVLGAADDWTPPDYKQLRKILLKAAKL
jgi:hypothetical protein